MFKVGDKVRFNQDYGTLVRFRLDKVSDEPFNVSTATDQELADEYRRLLDLRLPVWEELINRGYLFRDGNNRSMTPAASGEEVSITKEERTVISL